MTSKKVLLAGDASGKLSVLFKRVAAVNKSNGPFDLLLCTGAFFAPEGASSNTGEAGDEVLEYITGLKPVPIDTYFIGASGEGAHRALDALSLAQAAAPHQPSIHYLGRAGLTSLKGLSVAFLDGAYHSQAAVSTNGSSEDPLTCSSYSQEAVQTLKTALKQATSDVDILLTREWPAGVSIGAPPDSLPAGCSTSGSEVIAELAKSVRPRYHIAATNGYYYDRPPISIKTWVQVGNTRKQKYLHALGLIPAADMDLATLSARPANTTPSPYEEAPGSRKRPLDAEDGGGEQSWRWQQNKRQQPLGRPGVVKDESCSVYAGNLPFRATEDDLVAFFSPAGRIVDVRRRVDDDGKPVGYAFIQYDSHEAVQRACLLSGQILQSREISVRQAEGSRTAAQPQDGKPVEGCWFCLSNPNADVHLAVSIGEESYMACDKGPIHPHHVLILPVEHQRSSVAVPGSVYAEIERYLTALRSCYASKGMELFAFERFMQFKKAGGNHCQVNALPIASTSATEAAATLQRMAGKHGFKLEPVSGPHKGQGAQAALQAMVKDQEYFCATLPGGQRLVHIIGRGEKHPLSFGRDVAAALAGVPDRADWKVCQEGRADEEQRADAFKKLFQAYDIMET